MLRYSTHQNLLFFSNERLQALGGLGGCNHLTIIVEIDELVSVVTHAKLLHVGKLTKAMTTDDTLHVLGTVSGRMVL